MVGHEVDNDLHAGLMGALHQLLELLHALLHVDSQVRVHVVVVGDGIGRTSLTLHHSGVLAGNAVGRVVGLRGVTDNARIPHMTVARLRQLLQHLRREVVHLATTVLSQRTVLLPSLVTIAVQSRKNLIDQNLLLHNMIFYFL